MRRLCPSVVFGGVSLFSRSFLFLLWILPHILALDQIQLSTHARHHVEHLRVFSGDRAFNHQDYLTLAQVLLLAIWPDDKGMTFHLRKIRVSLEPLTVEIALPPSVNSRSIREGTAAPFDGGRAKFMEHGYRRGSDVCNIDIVWNAAT